MTRKLSRAYQLFREEGLRGFSKRVYAKIELEVSIFMHGAHKVIFLDGCQFQLRGLPNVPMKLELLTGRYEQPERDAARRYIRSEWPVVELGGCFGVVACITNKLLRNPQAHVVVEANPLVIPFLTSNRDDNCCSFKIVNRALAYDSKTVTFRPQADFWGNSLLYNSRRPPVTVMTTQLRQILQEEKFEKFALICDVEGLEYELVMQEPDALVRAELIVMEVHPHIIGKDKVQSLLARLGTLGFKTIQTSEQVFVLGKS